MPPNAASSDELADWHMHSVLVVDDEPGMVNFLRRALAARCGVLDSAGDVASAAALLQRQHYDLIILDISLPGGRSGTQWLHELRGEGFAGDVVLMTAYADLDTAIDALRAGAADFLLKPFSLAQLLNAVKRCFERSRLQQENYVLRREVTAQGGLEGLVGQSEAMRLVCERLKRIAPTPSTVLLLGESGTGKEVAARALHRMSPRADGLFVPVNCAAIAADLIESELFGHVKGAYSGASSSREGLFYYARGGTLFLDEIGELPLAAQAKLLRALEERRVRPVGSEQEIPVNARVVAATNRDLAQEVAAGRFRQDLYYRLQVMEIELPALRERPEDIPELINHFTRQLAGQLGVPPVHPDAASLRRLQGYDWPGNVRELRNLVERSLIFGYYDLKPEPAAAAAEAGAALPAQPEVLLEAVEKRHILAVLNACGGNKSEAARQLGVSRKTLDRKCNAWGV